MLASLPSIQPSFLGTSAGAENTGQAKSVAAFKQLFESVDFVASSSSKGSLSVPEDKYEPINGTPKPKKPSSSAENKSPSSVSAPPTSPKTPTTTPSKTSNTPKRKTLYSGDIDVSWPTPPNFRDRATGLHNVGNTCFLNSALQCLLHTPPLIRLLIAHTSCGIQGFCMICAMREVALKAHTGSNAFNPSAVTSKLHLIAKHLKRGRQEDSHEFLRYAIDALQKACLHGQPPKLDPAIAETTWVNKIFSGKLRSRVTCQSCGYNSDTFDSMMDLSLDIYRTSTIGQALKKFVATDYLKGSDKYKCDKCKKHVNAEKRFSIHAAPLVLTVHFKRFSPLGSKLSHAIEYPPSLSLKPFMSENSFGPTYSLYGVICHSGGGPHSGHYFAHVKSKGGKWNEMNDEFVGGGGSVLGLKNAYMLFYVQEKGQKLNGVVSIPTTPSTPSMVPPKLASSMKKRKDRGDEDTGESVTSTTASKPFIGPTLPDSSPSAKKQKVDPQAKKLESKISALATLEQYGSDDAEVDEKEDVQMKETEKEEEQQVEEKQQPKKTAGKEEAIPATSFYASNSKPAWKSKSTGFSPYAARLGGSKPFNNKNLIVEVGRKRQRRLVHMKTREMKAAQHHTWQAESMADNVVEPSRLVLVQLMLKCHLMAILATLTIALFTTCVAALPRTISGRSDAGQVSLDIWQTWRNPEDTLTILLIIGGDIVATALAQLSGPTIVPVAFSFGWVAYSFSVLVKTFGTGRLLPEPDYPVKLFNAQSGIVRENKSWVMGRFMRDGERPLDEATALQIVVYERTSGGRPAEDWCYYSGIIVILIQLGVAAIPCGLYGDWNTLLITGIGTVLALLTGALPQWSQEKFSGRRRTPERAKPKTVVLTKGNGSRNVIVIVDNTKDGGIDLEDLAASQSPLLRVVASEPMVFGLPRKIRVTQFASVVLAILWTIFLLVTTSPKQHPWYLLLVGGLGMLQNVIVAGAKRTPSAHGIHISDTPIAEFKRKKVMHALMDTEDEYPGVGKVLLSEFFAIDTLRDDEKKWWDPSEARDRTPYESRREKQQQKERQRIAQGLGGQD